MSTISLIYTRPDTGSMLLLENAVEWPHTARPVVGDVIYIRREYDRESATTVSSGGLHPWVVTRVAWTLEHKSVVLAVGVQPILEK